MSLRELHFGYFIIFLEFGFFVVHKIMNLSFFMLSDANKTQILQPFQVLDEEDYFFFY